MWLRIQRTRLWTHGTPKVARRRIVSNNKGREGRHKMWKRRSDLERWDISTEMWRYGKPAGVQGRDDAVDSEEPEGVMWIIQTALLIQNLACHFALSPGESLNPALLFPCLFLFLFFFLRQFSIAKAGPEVQQRMNLLCESRRPWTPRFLAST